MYRKGCCTVPSSGVGNGGGCGSNSRVALVREKYLENEFFQVREKPGNLVDGQGNLERTWKVREKSGNLKINGYGR